MLKTSLFNLILRGSTMASRFVLLLFLARFLTPEDLGIWGLMNVTIVMSLYFLGLDFYVFNTRELLATDDKKRVQMIRDQFVFHGIMYLIVLPLLLAVFLLQFISWQYVGWFYLILVLEHLSQEAARLLTTLFRPVMANLVLFFRSGAWIYAVVAVAYLKNDLRGLTTIWIGWVVGVTISIIIAVYILRFLPWSEIKSNPVDWGWIKKGTKIALPFLLSTMAMVGIQYIDRYFIQYFYGEAQVGFYTFYAQIANVIFVFIFTGINMILYPKIIEAFQKGMHEKYRALMKKMSFGIIGGIIALSVVAAVLINPLLMFLNRTEYTEYSYIFYILLLAVAFMTVSYIPHYALFVRKKDKAIVGSSIAALVVSTIANFILVPLYGLSGAAYAAVMSMGTMFLGKLIMAARQKEARPQKMEQAEQPVGL